MASRVSKIYGDAYVSLKAEEGKLLQAAEEVMAMKEIMKQYEELIAFLCHPQITKKQKMEKSSRTKWKEDLTQEWFGPYAWVLLTL